jgi:hypothetical protein
MRTLTAEQNRTEQNRTERLLLGCRQTVQRGLMIVEPVMSDKLTGTALRIYLRGLPV